MTTLKQVIHYQDTNSVEATWADSEGVVIKCHSYADVQMQMFRDDVAEFGGDITEHEELIALVESNIKPVEPVIIEIPQIITNYQGKVTLDAFQLLDDVEAYMALEDTPKQYKLAWATGHFERQSALLQGIAALFDLTDEQIDQMFIIAGKVS